MGEDRVYSMQLLKPERLLHPNANGVHWIFSLLCNDSLHSPRDGETDGALATHTHLRRHRCFNKFPASNYFQFQGTRGEREERKEEKGEGKRGEGRRREKKEPNLKLSQVHTMKVKHKRKERGDRRKVIPFGIFTNNLYDIRGGSVRQLYFGEADKKLLW